MAKWTQATNWRDGEKREIAPCTGWHQWTQINARTLGQSPMGMDLIPFYGAASGFLNNSSVGTVKVFRQKWFNNLGVRTGKLLKAMLKPRDSNCGLFGLQRRQDRHYSILASKAGIEKSFKSNGDLVWKKASPLFDLYSPTLGECAGRIWSLRLAHEKTSAWSLRGWRED